MFLPESYWQLAAEVAEVGREQSAQRLAQQHSPAIRILLVSKYQSCIDICSALDFFAKEPEIPLPNLGESYVQGGILRLRELEQYYADKIKLAKNLPQPQLGIPQLEMIGPLQSNKAAKAAEVFSTVHSVSSYQQLKALDTACIKQQRRLDIFLQYNASNEQQKHGCRSYDELRQLVDELLEHSSQLCLRGLMCMSAADSSKVAKRRAFANCRELAQRLWGSYAHKLPHKTSENPTPPLLPQFELSMGMSQDYPEALAEGANVLRIGSLLFSA